MDTGGPKVAGNENSVPGGAHRCQEARSLQVYGHQVTQRFLPETFDDVLVVPQHVGGDGAVEAVGDLDGVVDRVLHQGPGGEGGAGHQDCSVEQTCKTPQSVSVSLRWTRDKINYKCERQRQTFSLSLSLKWTWTSCPSTSVREQWRKLHGLWLYLVFHFCLLIAAYHCSKIVSIMVSRGKH